MKILVIFTALLAGVSCLNINITNLSNCADIPLDYAQDAEIEVADVTYEKNEKGFVDIVHGKYLVHVHQLDHLEAELILDFFKCPKDHVGICNENKKEYVEPMTCKRFLEDSSGPWYMFAPAMDDMNVCAQLVGTYQFTKAHLNVKHFEKYVPIEEGRYRIKSLYHITGRSMELKNLRGCVEIDFDILK